MNKLINLSEAQLGILDLVAQGYQDDTIAQALDKSRQAIRFSLVSIYRSLGLHSKSQGTSPRTLAALYYYIHKPERTKEIYESRYAIPARNRATPQTAEAETAVLDGDGKTAD